MLPWSRSVVAVALLAAPACFYADPINERPSADISQVDPELPYRGDPIDVWPAIVDPDDDPTTVEWRAYACDAPWPDGCDGLPYDTDTEYEYQFLAPSERLSGAPATLLHLELDVTDQWGARAVPKQTLDLPLADHDPILSAPEYEGPRFEGRFTVGTAVTVVIHASDADDPGALTFTDPPTVFPPDGVSPTAATVTRVATANVDDASWEILPTEPGDWKLRVEVADPLDDPTAPEVDRHHDVVDVPFAFDPDQAPCLGLTDPAFPPEGAYVVLDQRRRFSVETVRDDRDVYPPPLEHPEVYGTAHFRWFLDGQPLAVDGNAVELDPAAYLPGDHLALRVEAVDRVDQPLCDPASASCEDRPGCFQRQTWSVEVR